MMHKGEPVKGHQTAGSEDKPHLSGWLEGGLWVGMRSFQVDGLKACCDVDGNSLWLGEWNSSSLFYEQSHKGVFWSSTFLEQPLKNI